MIKSFVGPMYSDKSAHLVEIYNSIWNKAIILAFKPKIDTRDGSAIKSKKYAGIEIPAIFVDSIEEIKKHVITSNCRTVFIDEAQFLTGDVHELVDLSVILGIDFYIAGLNMTSEQEPFGIIPNILAVSDDIVIVNGYCQDCNKPSVYSYSLDTEKIEKIKVGNEYISLCPSCLKRRILKSNNNAKSLRLEPCFIEKSSEEEPCFT